MMAPNRKKKKLATNASRGFATVSLPSKKAVAAEDDPKDELDHPIPSHPEAEKNPPLDVASGESVDHHGSTLEYSQNSVQIAKTLADGDIEMSELHILWDKHRARCRDEVSRQIGRLKAETHALRIKAVPVDVDQWMADDIISSILARASSDSLVTLTSTDNVSSLVTDEFLLKLWALRQVLTQLQIPNVEDALAHVVTLFGKGQLTISKDDLLGLPEALEWTVINNNPEKLSSIFYRPESESTQQPVEKETFEGSIGPTPPPSSLVFVAS